MSTTSSPVASPAQLSIKSRWLSEDVVRIALTGEIDFATTEELQAGLLGVILAGLPHRIEVDLAGVPFMDCSGISVLVIARQAAARAGCRLRITRPQPIVRRILEMTGLLDILIADPIGLTPVRGTAQITTAGGQPPGLSALPAEPHGEHAGVVSRSR